MGRSGFEDAKTRKRIGSICARAAARGSRGAWRGVGVAADEAAIALGAARQA